MFPDNLSGYNILLASNSPRRRELLSMLGLNFEVLSLKGVDEVYPNSLSPERVAEYLARLKAEACHPLPESSNLIITADTTVVCDSRVLGKPSDSTEAIEMLKLLSGRTHSVFTGVAVATSERLESFTSATSVTFAPLSDDEISFYVDRFRPFDKAGAYGIQEWIGAIAISRIDGSYYNVMGLPVHRLYRLLLSF